MLLFWALTMRRAVVHITAHFFGKIQGSYIMSMHRSLKSASKIATKRNVLKRYERVDVLRAKGDWKPGDKVYGLRKTNPPT